MEVLDYISIHAPREGRDVKIALLDKAISIFQSTRPARGATAAPKRKALVLLISIHAPREGRDRPVQGGDYDPAFQSTRPARGATCTRSGSRLQARKISIHAPREGRDKCAGG